MRFGDPVRRSGARNTSPQRLPLRRTAGTSTKTDNLKVDDKSADQHSKQEHNVRYEKYDTGTRNMPTPSSSSSGPTAYRFSNRKKLAHDVFTSKPTILNGRDKSQGRDNHVDKNANSVNKDEATPSQSLYDLTAEIDFAMACASVLDRPQFANAPVVIDAKHRIPETNTWHTVHELSDLFRMAVTNGQPWLHHKVDLVRALRATPQEVPLGLELHQAASEKVKRCQPSLYDSVTAALRTNKADFQKLQRVTGYLYIGYWVRVGDSIF